MNKYKLYNETKGIWEYVISDVVPTVLPINPLDTVLPGSVVVVEPNILYNDGTAKQLLYLTISY